MDEIVQDFLIESRENLDRLDQELIQLESDPSSKDLLASIFRTIHTIKGSCGFLGFPRLQKVSHTGENLLSRLRDGELALNSEITSALLAMVDAIRQMLAAIQSTEGDGEEDYAALIERLTCLQNRVADAAPSESLIPESHAQNLSDKAVPAEQARIATVGKETPSAKPDAASAPASSGIPIANPGLETVRVSVPLLDRLMNLVGELVLARNQLLQFSNDSQDAHFQTLSQRMNLITSELQEQVMRTRLQPIETIWSKFPRSVRDLALSCGKEVHIEMEGKETELDRTIIEAIKDPLTHLLRNAVDHGIESPDTRTRAGKSSAGELRLRASHEAGQVCIEISDDGGGLNVASIRSKAVERGLLSAEQAARLNERDAANLIFLPGFSTAEKVSSVSGRGVGLDVVRTNVESIGGTVDVRSVQGRGTTIRMRIPLTLAIIPALIVVSAGERFAVPQVSLIELARVAPEQIEFVGDAAVYRLRGRLLPLISLDGELGLARTNDGPSDRRMLVLQTDAHKFGLLVDGIGQTEEIVVKPLAKQLNGVGPFSGATIMGDGRVALILDLGALAKRAGLTGESRHNPATEIHRDEEGTDENAITARQVSMLLLVQCGESRMAIPLSAVARLEEFPRTALEHSATGPVVQYRGRILPLINISAFLSASHAATPGPGTDEALKIVVYTDNNSSVGLVVDGIVDLVAAPAAQAAAGRDAQASPLIVQQRVTDMLDVPALIRQAIPGFGERRLPV